MLSLESIRENTLECKSVLAKLYTPIVIITVGICAYGLGALSTKEGTLPIEHVAMPEIAAEPHMLGGLYVASRAGSKYHYPWCSGARSITEKNKIWFKSSEEARAAGYTPAKNCKGLE